MKCKKWLTITSRGATRLTHGKPRVSVDEVSIFLEIKIPDEMFKRPRLEAKINIPEEAVEPNVLNAEVVENVRDAIERATGLTFAINVIKEESESSEK